MTPGMYPKTTSNLLEINPIVTKIAPENKPSQKETNIPTVHFQVLQYVSFREGRVIKLIHSLLVDFSAL